MPDRDHSDDKTTPVSSRRPPGPVILAGALAVLLVVGIGVATVIVGPDAGSGPSSATSATAAAPTGPLPLGPVEAPQADSAACASLLAQLPAVLSNTGSPLPRRKLATPAPMATAAWGGAAGDPVVLRCGVAQPAELTPTAELLEVSGVRWLQVASDHAVTWYAVDRPVCVALTLPGDVSTGPIQDVSAAIATTLPVVPVHPAGG